MEDTTTTESPTPEIKTEDPPATDAEPTKAPKPKRMTATEAKGYQEVCTYLEALLQYPNQPARVEQQLTQNYATTAEDKFTQTANSAIQGIDLPADMLTWLFKQHSKTSKADLRGATKAMAAKQMLAIFALESVNVIRGEAGKPWARDSKALEELRRQLDSLEGVAKFYAMQDVLGR